MLIRTAAFIVTVAEGYAAIGFVFAVLFLPRAAARMDAGLSQAPFGVRLLILPGVVAFWPLFAARWARGSSAPVERNPHRDRVASS